MFFSGTIPFHKDLKQPEGHSFVGPAPRQKENIVEN